MQWNTWPIFFFFLHKKITHSAHTQQMGHVGESSRRQLHQIYLVSLQSWCHKINNKKQKNVGHFCQNKCGISFFSANFFKGLKWPPTTLINKRKSLRTKQIKHPKSLAVAFLFCWYIGSITLKYSSCEKQIIHLFHDVRIIYAHVSLSALGIVDLEKLKLFGAAGILNWNYLWDKLPS